MSTARAVIQPIVIAILLAFAVRASSIGIYSIPSQSMEPTLHVGDLILVTPYVGDHTPAHGDVIVFRSPSKPDELVVKRVVATAGDLIESRDGNVFVCGHTLAEPYVNARGNSGGIAPQIVASQSFYVLGDNRANSYDSRVWGAIPRERVVGHVQLILWSPSPTTATVLH